MSKPRLALPSLALPSAAFQDVTVFGGAGERYFKKELLGEGTYGAVFRCFRARDEEVFAVKILSIRAIASGRDGLPYGHDPKHFAQERVAEVLITREVDALRRLCGHPGIVSLQSAFCCEASKQVYIVTEFVSGGTLRDALAERAGPFDEPPAAHVAAQLVDAVSFCHGKGVVHRDLKLENVLVADVDVRMTEVRCPGTGAPTWRMDEIFTVKIADFGFAKVLSATGPTTCTPVGTQTYAAPEIRLGGGDTFDGVMHRHDSEHAYDAFKVDAYALGVSIYILLCLRLPPQDRGEGSHRVHERWHCLSAGARSLLDGLLVHDPAGRLAVAELGRQEWISKAASVAADDPVEEEDLLSSTPILWTRVTSSWRGPAASTAVEGHGEDLALDWLLALQRLLVALQRERAVACWALGYLLQKVDPETASEKMYVYSNCSDTRITGVEQISSEILLGSGWSGFLNDFRRWVVAPLTDARALTSRAGRCLSDVVLRAHFVESFDIALASFDSACRATTNFIFAACPEVRSPEIFDRWQFVGLATFAELLARERALIRSQLSIVLTSGSGAQAADFSSHCLTRIEELIRHRQASDAISSNPLSEWDIEALEAAEVKALGPDDSRKAGIDEVHECLTQMVNELHSHIAEGLVRSMRMSRLQGNRWQPFGGRGLLKGASNETSCMGGVRGMFIRCGCRC
eukprot:CAMPEP_0177495612 /NCGR_PEP_ID=MMETSP0369-20130122/34066_1 /TAXON_ID=447022 ORGANISM="Scrippsiella hangoei-like, Strain SHHI-4" /NCGR_SAMPLE_ID=MMETSP0369 /ASSEMBLY_ACC=CAM_ASM_000364 /LENGTH=688 /DNA_ID=CAMNT_0018972627 /DNA_START=26 /DNA_END=2092 /DNA_ORIENTATION=+